MMQLFCSSDLTEHLGWSHGSSLPAVDALEHQPVLQAVRILPRMSGGLTWVMTQHTSSGQSGFGCGCSSLSSLEASQLAGSVALLNGGRPYDACARGGA